MTEFFRFCIVCKSEVPQDRLDRGADTCSTQCKRMDRKAQRKRQKEIARRRLLLSGWFRELVRGKATELVAEKQAKRSAPQRPMGASAGQ